MEFIIANTGANISSVETYFDKVHVCKVSVAFYKIRDNWQQKDNNSPRQVLFQYSEAACYGRKHICFVLSSVVFSTAPFRMGLGSPSRTV